MQTYDDKGKEGNRMIKPGEMINILVIEDDAEDTALLVRCLKANHGIRLATTESVESARTRLMQNDFDLILMDLGLPGYTGLDAFENIHKAAPYIPIVVLTGLDVKNIGQEAVSKGAQDYLVKGSVDTAILERAIQYALERHRILAQLENANLCMRRDLNDAAKIQRALLPKSVPLLNGVNFAWVFNPCESLAGDIFNIVKFDEHRAGLYILDVAGHGVRAALKAMSVSQILQNPPDILSIPDENGCSRLIRSPAEVVAKLNQAFPIDLKTCQFFTLIYGILDTKAGEFRFSSAGHPAAIHIPRQGAPYTPQLKGMVIGVLPEAVYEEKCIKLAPGDRVYLYSDGVTETQSPDRQEFGLERLIACLEKQRDCPLNDTIETLMKELDAWRQTALIHDDISMMVFEIQT